MGAANYGLDFADYFPTHRAKSGVRWFEINGMSGMRKNGSVYSFDNKGEYMPGNPLMITGYGASADGHPNGIWRCPSVTVIARLHYGLNYYAFGAYPNELLHMSALNMTKVQHPSELLFASEYSQYISNFMYPSVSPFDASVANTYNNANPHLILRHSNKANVLFFDGHVAGVSGRANFSGKEKRRAESIMGIDRLLSRKRV